MTSEFTVLLVMTALLIATPLVYGSFVLLDLGVPTVWGNREDFPKLTGWKGRAQRAHMNLLENLVPFAIAVFLLRFLGVSNWWTVTGAYVFLAARLIHVVTYVAGVPYVRSLSYNLGLAGIVMVASQCF